MKALLSSAPGGPETLAVGDLPEPVAAAGEVVVAVQACGVNFPDTLIIADRYQFRPQRPFAPGGEIAGTVAAVGEQVTGLAIGDRVIALTGWGGMAERVAVAAARCVAMPAGMPFDEAAALLFTYGTAFHALKDRAALCSGETLLVLGAAGGVGIAAVELGRSMGARVVAAASSADKLAFAREHGASAGVEYPSGALDKGAAQVLAARFKEACGPRGADVVFDAVGGDYAEAALRAVAWEGRYLVVGFTAGIPKIPLNLPLLKACQIVGVFWGEWNRRDPTTSAGNNRALLELYGRNAIRPRISQRFPMAAAGEAIAALAERRAKGKLVVEIASSGGAASA